MQGCEGAGAGIDRFKAGLLCLQNVVASGLLVLTPCKWRCCVAPQKDMALQLLPGCPDSLQLFTRVRLVDECQAVNAAQIEPPRGASLVL